MSFKISDYINCANLNSEFDIFCPFCENRIPKQDAKTGAHSFECYCLGKHNHFIYRYYDFEFSHIDIITDKYAVFVDRNAIIYLSVNNKINVIQNIDFELSDISIKTFLAFQ